LSPMYSGGDARGTFAAVAGTGLLLVLLPYVILLASDHTGLVGLTPGDPAVRCDADPYENAWQFWWVGRALGDGHDPRWCPLIYWPGGASLAYDHVGWFDTLLLGATGAGERSPGLAHTVSLMIGTVLTALFGWLLARSWGAGRYGALFTALALAWLPSRTAHLLQHYQVANLWALPASLWAASRFVSGGRRRFASVFLLAALAGALESPFIVLFVILCLPAATWHLGGSWRRTGILAAFWVLSASAAALFLLSAPGETGQLARHWREAVIWAAEPQSFLLPSPFGPAGRILGMPLRMSWMTNVFEGVVTPGLVVLVLFLVFLRKERRWGTAAVVAAFWLLALGPELRMLGRPLGIPLPFRILQAMPLAGGIRAPSRLAIPGSVIAALGAGVAVSRLGSKWRYPAFFLLLLENALPSLPLLDGSIPGECAGLPEGSVVLEVPVDAGVRRYSWFQTEAGYRRRYAFMARMPDMPCEQELLDRALDEGDVIVYHRWLYEGEERDSLDLELRRLFPSAIDADSVWIGMEAAP